MTGASRSAVWWRAATTLVGLTVGAAVPAAPAAAQGADRGVDEIVERFWAEVAWGDLDAARALIHPEDVAAVVAALRAGGPAGLDEVALRADPIDPAAASDEELFAWFFRHQYGPSISEPGQAPNPDFLFIGWASVGGSEARAVLERRWTDSSTPRGPIRTLVVQPLRLDGDRWRLLLPNDAARLAGLESTSARLGSGVAGPGAETLGRFRAALARARFDEAVDLLHVDNVLRIATLAREAARRLDGLLLGLYYGLTEDGVSGLSDRELARAFLAVTAEGPLLGIAGADELHVECSVRDDDSDVLVFRVRGRWGADTGAIRVRDDEGSARIDLTGGVLSTAEAIAR